MTTPKIMLVGEAWGAEEEIARAPFVGASGKILNGMLAQVGIRRDDCYLTNVFNLRPEPTNDVKNLCGPKAQALAGYPALQSGKYVRAEFTSELERLYSEIQKVQPSLIIALGATPAWALLETSGIRKIRGAPSLLSDRIAKKVGKQIKVFPTYHPAAVMREWKLRPIVLADLAKATREATFPDLRRPSREIWIEPTIDDLRYFGRTFIDPSRDLSVDIETARDQITCVGFAPSIDRAIVVPFVDATTDDGNYWPTLQDEREAWRIVREWCSRDGVVGQNFLYDTHFLWRRYGITIPGSADDTMLMHHALQPEMEKGLGFLASIYTDELPWKFMRAKHETVKRED